MNTPQILTTFAATVALALSGTALGVAIAPGETYVPVPAAAAQTDDPALSGDGVRNILVPYQKG